MLFLSTINSKWNEFLEFSKWNEFFFLPSLATARAFFGNPGNGRKWKIVVLNFFRSSTNRSNLSPKGTQDKHARGDGGLTPLTGRFSVLNSAY